MTLEKLIEMFDGQDADKHTLEVSLADIRAWASDAEQLRAALQELLNANIDYNAIAGGIAYMSACSNAKRVLGNITLTRPKED